MPKADPKNVDIPILSLNAPPDVQDGNVLSQTIIIFPTKAQVIFVEHVALSIVAGQNLMRCSFYKMSRFKKPIIENQLTLGKYMDDLIRRRAKTRLAYQVGLCKGDQCQKIKQSIEPNKFI
jgi:hypothetical protein